MEIEKISEDKRPIESAWSSGSDGAEPVGATVGYRSVTAIQPYHEFGEMAPVTWLAIYCGDKLWMRLNCAHVAEIRYAVKSE